MWILEFWMFFLKATSFQRIRQIWFKIGDNFFSCSAGEKYQRIRRWLPYIQKSFPKNDKIKSCRGDKELLLKAKRLSLRKLFLLSTKKKSTIEQNLRTLRVHKITNTRWTKIFDVSTKNSPNFYHFFLQLLWNTICLEQFHDSRECLHSFSIFARFLFFFLD